MAKQTRKGGKGGKRLGARRSHENKDSKKEEITFEAGKLYAGRVVKVIEDKGFFFVKVAGVGEIFAHKKDYRAPRVGTVDRSPERPPGVGELVFLKITHAARGARAEKWCFRFDRPRTMRDDEEGVVHVNDLVEVGPKWIDPSTTRIVGYFNRDGWSKAVVYDGRTRQIAAIDVKAFEGRPRLKNGMVQNIVIEGMLALADDLAS